VNIAELIERLQAIQREVGSHPTLDGRLRFCIDDDDETELELLGIEPLLVPGCNCWHGAELRLRQTPAPCAHEWADSPTGYAAYEFCAKCGWNRLKNPRLENETP
jgi:hypothetical protein